MKFISILPILGLFIGCTATGNPSYPISVEPHNYTDAEGVLLQGFLSKPTDEKDQSPAVIVLHDQDGPNAYEQQRATLIAQELGYVGFAADVYGYGVELPPEDGSWGGPRAEFVGQYTSNATLFSTRIQAAVDYIQSLDYVDPTKIVLIGYCLGGTGIVHYLNTKGSDSSVAGACGVHPSLFGDWGGPTGSIVVPALFLTGGSDFLTGPEAMVTLESDMSASDDTPWETVRYAKIDHAFSNWFSEENYDERADARSWESFASFASEVFGTGAYPAEAVEANVAPANDYADIKNADYPLTGFTAFPDPLEEGTPIVIILPSTMDENGPGVYEQQRATQIAADHNYISFVADFYSSDRTDTSAEELEALYYSNTTKFMSRIDAAIEYTKTLRQADASNIALLGFGFGGSGALMYAMGVGGEIDPAVKVIATFHGDIAKTVNATADMFDVPAASTGFGSWSGGGGSWSGGGESSNGGSGSWGSGGWGSGEASTGDWGSIGGNESSSSSNVNASVSDEAPNYPWDQRSFTGSVQPQILIQSGVMGDDMSDVTKLETMLIGQGVNYELTRFSGAQGDFTNWESSTYDPRATVRSFDQFVSVLLEEFVDDDSTTLTDTAVTVPIGEITNDGDEPSETVETGSTSPAHSGLRCQRVKCILELLGYLLIHLLGSSSLSFFHLLFLYSHVIKCYQLKMRSQYLMLIQ